MFLVLEVVKHGTAKTKPVVKTSLILEGDDPPLNIGEIRDVLLSASRGLPGSVLFLHTVKVKKGKRKDDS